MNPLNNPSEHKPNPKEKEKKGKELCTRTGSNAVSAVLQFMAFFV